MSTHYFRRENKNYLIKQQISFSAGDVKKEKLCVCSDESVNRWNELLDRSNKLEICSNELENRSVELVNR